MHKLRPRHEHKAANAGKLRRYRLSEPTGSRIQVRHNKTKMKARLAKNSPATGRKPASDRAKKLSQLSASKGKRALSEDEADILYCEKHKHEKAIPWEQVKAKLDAMDG